MNKIKVGETIGNGYGFAVRRIVANAGLSWLAAAFYAVAAGYWLHQFCTTMLVSPHPGSELNDFALFDLFGLVVTTALGSAVIARALTGTALEPGGETMTAYFAVAKREWILFLSLLRLYVFCIAGLFAVVLLGGYAIAMVLPMIGGNVQWQGIGVQSALEAAVAVIGFALIATLAVRLGFFAAAVASAEWSASMTRNWSLSAGNSWRVFAAILGLSLPVLLLWAAVEYALMGSDLSSALAIALSPSHNSTALYQLIDGNASSIAGAWTLLLVVLNMLFAGASAPAYLAVRDNVAERQPRAVRSPPDIEPAFAGSFAGFAPRHDNEPAASGFAQHAETFAAGPETATTLAAEAPVEAVNEAPAAEEGLASPLIEDATLPSEPEHPGVLDAHAEDTREPIAHTDEISEAPVLEDHAENVAEHEAEAAEVEDITPPPSHADAPEFSQQNAPSEAA